MLHVDEITKKRVIKTTLCSRNGSIQLQETIDPDEFFFHPQAGGKVSGLRVIKKKSERRTKIQANSDLKVREPK